MEYLASHDFRVCSVSELVQSRCHPVSDGTPRLAALTFDDAFRELSTHAVPVLERLGFGATIYVPTAYIGASSKWLQASGEGTRPILGAEELRELARSGIECGAHSHTHIALDAVPIDVAAREIELSKNVLEERTEQEVRSFAYPFGYESPRIRALVAGAGYTSACRVNYTMSCASEDVFGLSRLPVYGDCTLDQFASLVTGRASLHGRRALAMAWRPVRRILARAHGQ